MGTSTLDGTFGHLRDRGVRLTAARRLVIEALFATDRPISAEEIASGVGGRLPRSDVAAGYRNPETPQRPRPRPPRPPRPHPRRPPEGGGGGGPAPGRGRRGGL